MPHALRAYACTVLHVDICVCLYVSSCCLSVQLRTCMRLTVVICRHSVKVRNGPRKYLGPIGKPAIGVLTESQLRHNMPWLEMYMKLLLLRHITELEVSMMYSTQHCTLELQRKTTTLCYKTGTTGSLQVGEIYCFACIKSIHEQKILQLSHHLTIQHIFISQAHKMFVFGAEKYSNPPSSCKKRRMRLTFVKYQSAFQFIYNGLFVSLLIPFMVY